ncbi:HK97-gp10 family putative phage morphogenesis protein, partial [Rhizobiaceae sp. 2RAB30]
LEQFKKSTARGVLERALKKAAKPIEQTAKADVPVDTGELKRSVGIEVVRNNAGKAAYAEAMRSGASRSEAGQAAREANRAAAGQGASATVRVAAKAPHAIFVEFGTRRGMPSRPFLSTAMRSRSGQFLAILKDELGNEIEKTAKRVARRAAKKGKS